MSVTETSGSIVAQPGQQYLLSSLITLGPGLPATIGLDLFDANSYTEANPGSLGYLTGNGTRSQVTEVTSDGRDFTVVLFQYDPQTGEYYNSTLGYWNDITVVAPTGNNHAELLTVFTFKNGSTFNLSNLNDLGDLSIATQTSPFVNPFPGAMAGQATPNEICAIAQSFVGKVWNNEGCGLLAQTVASLAGATLPFTATVTDSFDKNPIFAQPNGEWIVAYDGRTQANPSYAAAEAMVRPGDVINVAWVSNTGGHAFTVVSGSGADAMVVDNWQTIINSAQDGSPSDIIIEQPHSLDLTLNEGGDINGGAEAASIQVYRLDTPIIAAQAAPVLLAGTSTALATLFSASDPAGKAVVEYQVYDSASGNVFSVGNTQQAAHSAADAITVQSLGSISLVEGTGGGSDTLEVRGFNGTYWGDWQALTVTAVPSVTAAQAISDASAGQVSAGTIVADTAQNVVASLDALAALAAKNGLASIVLTDGGVPNLIVTAAQASNDAGVLAEISSSHAVTVQFTGDAGLYTVTAANGGISVAGNGVNEQLSNVAALQFADFTEIVAAPPGSANAVTTGNVTELYSAVLARQPDVGGLAFYQAYLQQNPGTPLQQFAEWFLTSAEYTANPAHAYAQSSAGDTQFIEDVYQNLLHRTPGASEVAFYENNVLAPAVAGLTPGTQAYAAAQLQAHAQMLVYFSGSAEFLSDVQVTATAPASAQHWLVLT